MMEMLKNPNIQYVLIVALFMLFIFLIRKFNIKNDHKVEIDMGLDIIDFLIKNSNVKIEDKEKITVMVKYIKEAIKFVDEYNKNEENKEEIKRLIRLETISICQENNILVDDETIDLIDKLTNYLVDMQ